MLAEGDAPLPVSNPNCSGALDLLFVQDVIEPVTRAAQAVAQARYAHHCSLVRHPFLNDHDDIGCGVCHPKAFDAAA